MNEHSCTATRTTYRKRGAAKPETSKFRSWKGVIARSGPLAQRLVAGLYSGESKQPSMSNIST